MTSPTWQFTVGWRSAPVDTSWGTTLDVNGDGYADLALSTPAATSADLTGTGNVYVYLAGRLTIVLARGGLCGLGK